MSNDVLFSIFEAKHIQRNKLWWHPQQQYHIIYIYIYIFICIFIYKYVIIYESLCLTTWTFFLHCGFAHVDNVITCQCSKQSHGCSCEGCRTGTLWNLPNPASGTYTSTHRNPPEPTPARAGTLRNLPQPSRTFRNLPELASGTYASTHRNLPSPEPSGTCLWNLHQHTPEPSGTFPNLSPEPAPATRSGTHRSLSGLKTPVAYAVGEIFRSCSMIIYDPLIHFKANPIVQAFKATHIKLRGKIRTRLCLRLSPCQSNFTLKSFESGTGDGFSTNIIQCPIIHVRQPAAFLATTRLTQFVQQPKLARLRVCEDNATI